MSFDATARNGVAPLTEKRERPRLPMVSFDADGAGSAANKDAFTP